ncbi:hypothetical protein Q2K19_05340 [Micromonospora soli]|uniref:hypothetical protein n=1 Tax=Micromonospora sp. NBRC 110009 TaxID=3061627 RepID=UPI002671821D|nr:hypothetical protein [Micromonospora sp. NBRC 110009]WKT99915.1 hypothetical protein Q2K19_05340 [Micromonospora sp. NBRC 110009]
MTAPRWIIHLPTKLTSQDAATDLAGALRGSLAHVAAFDFGETTLSEEDSQHLRHRVWCDARLDDGRRCRLRDGHSGSCGTTGER